MLKIIFLIVNRVRILLHSDRSIGNLYACHKMYLLTICICFVIVTCWVYDKISVYITYTY